MVAHPTALTLPRHGASAPAKGPLPPRGTPRVCVSRHEDSGWVSLGDALDVDPTRWARPPKLELDANDRPIVLWAEQVGTVDHLFAKRWNGTGWDAVGGETPLGSTLSVSAYAIAVATGRVSIVFTEVDPSGSTILRLGRLSGDGAAWLEQGFGFAMDPADFALTFDGSGTEVVAYANAGTAEIVRWQEGGPGRFVRLGEPLAAGGRSPSIASVPPVRRVRSS